MDKQTVEYYSALISKTVLTHATTWMDLEDIMLNDISCHKRTNTEQFHLFEVPTVVKYIETKSRMVGLSR